MDILLIVISISVPFLILFWTFPKVRREIVGLSGVALMVVYSPVSLLPLICTTGVGYWLLKKIPDTRRANLLSVSIISLILITYKLLGAVDVLSVSFLGLSYYSFKQIHVAVENYKGTLPDFSMIDYVGFLFFAPTFVVGPINRFNEFLKDTARLRWNDALFSVGLERIVYGLVKVSFLANYLMTFKLGGTLVGYLNQMGYEELATYVEVFTFTANAYFQFSGYSDVAIGLSALFGFRIIENFNFPFLASNISDFWKRWHISLSQWCMNYIFYPLLAKTRNALFSILVTMIVLGLWHEISLKYLTWAALQGLAIFVWNQYKQSAIHNFLSRYAINRYLGIFVTMHFVMLSFYLLKFDKVSAYFYHLSLLL